MRERQAHTSRGNEGESEFGHISPEEPLIHREIVILDTPTQQSFGLKVPRVSKEKGIPFNPRRSSDHKRNNQRRTLRLLTKNKIV